MAISNLLKSLLTTTVGAAFVALGAVGSAQAVVLTFDDVTQDPVALITNGYGGFNWDSFGVVDGSKVHPGSGYDKGTVSGTYTTFNNFGNLAQMTNGDFDFNGVYLTAAWNNGLSVVVEGLKDGTSLYSKTVEVDTTGPTWFDFNFLGVDQLKFTSFGGVSAGLQGGGTQFAMDNFTFNETKSVPEPASTLGLLALGAMGAGSMLKRKQQQKA